MRPRGWYWSAQMGRRRQKLNSSVVQQRSDTCNLGWREDTCGQTEGQA